MERLGAAESSRLGQGGEWTGSRCLMCVEGPGRAGLRTGGTEEFHREEERVFLGRPGGVGPGQPESPDLAGPSTPRGPVK